ncbi:MAG: nucleotide-binding universal stress UspA family protein [Natronomonas sp.]|jgi:nucleotide-binding universal stress UspA family protein
MTTVVGTASVHTTAAACDYLDGADRVVVVTATEGDTTPRDAGDAGNVARTRLPGATVETVERAGEPAAVIRDVAAEHDATRVVVGTRQGDPERAGDPPGSTVQALLAETDRPVVVVPV